MVRIHNHLKLIVRLGPRTHGELPYYYNITSKNPAGEMEAEFSKAFSGSNPLTASSMVKRWGTADTEIEKFLRKINELLHDLRQRSRCQVKHHWKHRPETSCKTDEAAPVIFYGISHMLKKIDYEI